MSEMTAATTSATNRDRSTTGPPKADPTGAPALSVVLGGVGSANLDGYAQRNQGKRLAIVTQGEVVSAPVLQFTSFAGRIQVTGLSKEKTNDLFTRLNKLIRSE